MQFLQVRQALSSLKGTGYTSKIAGRTDLNRNAFGRYFLELLRRLFIMCVSGKKKTYQVAAVAESVGAEVNHSLRFLHLFFGLCAMQRDLFARFRSKSSQLGFKCSEISMSRVSREFNPYDEWRLDFFY